MAQAYFARKLSAAALVPYEKNQGVPLVTTSIWKGSFLENKKMDVRLDPYTFSFHKIRVHNPRDETQQTATPKWIGKRQRRVVDWSCRFLLFQSSGGILRGIVKKNSTEGHQSAVFKANFMQFSKLI